MRLNLIALKRNANLIDKYGEDEFRGLININKKSSNFKDFLHGIVRHKTRGILLSLYMRPTLMQAPFQHAIDNATQQKHLRPYLQ
uniref:uncharacterized protein LOC120334359 isoform X2 n=1 Tax=Styela clava TaxID=7725 RepID=UPI00193ABDFE|nr:uncharacterized protein LOC120334359 isoform X2 [Styela clava]